MRGSVQKEGTRIRDKNTREGTHQQQHQHQHHHTKNEGYTTHDKKIKPQIQVSSPMIQREKIIKEEEKEKEITVQRENMKSSQSCLKTNPETLEEC